MSGAASTAPARPRPSPPNPWKPGQSGNPKGRAPSPVDIAALAREHGPRCIEVAADLLDSDDERIRLAAATALLDRGFGKPVQTLSGEDGAPLTIVLRHLVDDDTLTIEHEPHA